jgi:HSP90 family molecular chaperone
MKKNKVPQSLYGTPKSKVVKVSASSMTQGIKDLEAKKKYDSLMKMYEEKSKDYVEVLDLYQACIRTGVSNEMYQQALLKCEELIAANKSLDEAVSAEKKNVELLKHQAHNNATYISRLNDVIAALNLQIFKK